MQRIFEVSVSSLSNVYTVRISMNKLTKCHSLLLVNSVPKSQINERASFINVCFRGSGRGCGGIFGEGSVLIQLVVKLKTGNESFISHPCKIWI